MSKLTKLYILCFILFFKFEDLIGFIEQFVSWTVSHLVNSREVLPHTVHVKYVCFPECQSRLSDTVLNNGGTLSSITRRNVIESLVTVGGPQMWL